MKGGREREREGEGEGDGEKERTNEGKEGRKALGRFSQLGLSWEQSS